MNVIGKLLDGKDFVWCRGAELNRRHTDFQSVALPTELPRHSSLLRNKSEKIR